MATALEIAKQREEDKLRRAGLGPDGRPLAAGNDNRGGGDNDDDDEEELERQRLQDEEDERQRQQAQGGGDQAAEIVELRRQLAALQGRVAPAQQTGDEYRRLWEGERQARAQTEAELRTQIEALQRTVEAATPAFSVNSILTAEEIQDIDPLVLSAMTKIAEGIAKNTAPKIDVRASTLQVLDEREKERVVQHRNRVMTDPTRGLHQLGQLAYDPQFLAWSREDDNDVDSVITSLLSATSTEEVDRYAKIVAKRIAKFQSRNKAPPTDARASLSGHMRRSEPSRMTDAERQVKLNEAKNLSRSRNPADRVKAQQILNDLN